MCMAQGAQRSDADEARTVSPQSWVKHSTTEPLNADIILLGEIQCTKMVF